MVNKNATKITKTIIYKPDAVIEGWYAGGSAQMYVLLLPPHPMLGGSISNTLLRKIHQAFHEVGFGTLRINYRGVGLSKGSVNDRSMDLQDALDALDWLSLRHNEPKVLWIAGFGYGGYITVNAAMRRPGVHGFVSVTPYTDTQFEFNMLTPCPNGLVITGGSDKIVDPLAVKKIVKDLSNQRGCSIIFEEIDGADHNYVDKDQQLQAVIKNYLQSVLHGDAALGSMTG
jgi:uncharacterized protein